MRGPLCRLNPDTNEAGSGARRKEERVRRRTLLAGAALVAVPLLMMRAGAPREGRSPSPRFPASPASASSTRAASRLPCAIPSRACAPPATRRRPSRWHAVSSVRRSSARSRSRPARCRSLRSRTTTAPTAATSRSGWPRAPTRPPSHWHELPLLGDASEAAARAALAADLQGAYPAFQARLLRATFQPTDAYLADLGVSLGLDVPRLLADARRGRRPPPRHLCPRGGDAWHRATPALVVGRTLVSGAISDDRLDALIALERAEGSPPC
jgi:hypothetical protein